MLVSVSVRLPSEHESARERGDVHNRDHEHDPQRAQFGEPRERSLAQGTDPDLVVVGEVELRFLEEQRTARQLVGGEVLLRERAQARFGRLRTGETRRGGFAALQHVLLIMPATYFGMLACLIALRGWPRVALALALLIAFTPQLADLVDRRSS